jgi:hypothetical protein
MWIDANSYLAKKYADKTWLPEDAAGAAGLLRRLPIRRGMPTKPRTF